ncbi:methyltransferase domain-containing protein [Echinicola sp. CAU 1574]|uniref:Methyltransferase domain-containing protein n=1 Tax=Echinicola arenosa TaxID=2774144 RepID=A0ABR9AFY9_9BACT|nr:methyltransferase domain-containing protein [Echinicola arenosa]MBD8487555.1 methyltransferase domain-containing protein [Echinicola arenosa]
MSQALDENYWTSRYLDQNTGWDVGEATVPLKQYLDQIVNHGLEILVPGAGNAHEAVYAHKKGFKNVHILDFAEPPLRQFKERFPEFPKGHIHHENFFDHQGQYDLILEQTFFCALKPNLRNDYIKKMAELLKPSGRLVGVLFDVDFEKDGPPFGGAKQDYLEVFSQELEIVTMERCYNSIPPRAGNELFFKAKRKSEV